jgi:prepilin-type N-terminal cleavage/methylation domain-containing protein
MSRFFKKQGFTLIELMVVIVIIGVLASLAIPRFTEASAKAKVAEAPRVIASYESAWLALVAEQGDINTTNLGNLIFETTAVNAESKWWSYAAPVTTGAFNGSAKATMGKVAKSATLGVTYNATDNSFSHTADNTNAATLQKYVPNFFR